MSSIKITEIFMTRYFKDSFLAFATIFKLHILEDSHSDRQLLFKQIFEKYIEENETLVILSDSR